MQISLSSWPVVEKIQEIFNDITFWKLALGGGAFLITGYYIVKKDWNAPPGPRGYPILGVAPLLDKDYPHQSIQEIVRKYGNVCKLSILGQNITVVSGEKNIYDLYINKQDDFSNRIDSFRLKTMLNGNDEISTMHDGEKFREAKNITLRSLKTYGEGMEKVENISAEVIENFLSYIKGTNGEPVDIKTKLRVLFCNIITSMTLNKKIDEKSMSKFVEAYGKMSAIIINPHTAILEFFPWLKYFRNRWYNSLVRLAKLRESILMPIFKEHIENFDPNNAVTVLDQITLLMRNSKVNFSDVDIYSVLIVLIVAGYITTSSTLYALLPVLLANRHVEQKILDEISETIGFDRFPKLEDKFKMPYTEAVILEAHRFLTIVPFSLPHSATRDSSIGNFSIKKTDIIWANIWGLHHDEKIWGDPWNFRPERFLDNQGLLLPTDNQLRKWYINILNIKSITFIRKCFFSSIVYYHSELEEEFASVKIWQTTESSYS